MRAYFGFSAAVLFLCLCLDPRVRAAEHDWMKEFESPFSASCEVGGASFDYPAQFEASSTTRGVFLESKSLSGQISVGSGVRRTKEKAIELLVTKQGGDGVSESIIDGNTIFASTSVQGDQICRTYIIALIDDDDTTLYIQFRWKSENSIDYISMLDQIIDSVNLE